MKRIVLVGASGHGKVCAGIAKLNGYIDIRFLDDNPQIKKCSNYDVVGPSSDFYQYINDDTEFFVSIGDHKIRKKIQEMIEMAGGMMARLMHPKSVISESVSMGLGTVVMAGAIVNAETSIGKGCIINTASSVDHDCIIGDYCHIAVGAHVCGEVNVGNSSWIGAGATVSNNVNICGGCVIGAGAVVTKKIVESGTYIGVPAKKKS